MHTQSRFAWMSPHLKQRSIGCRFLGRVIGTPQFPKVRLISSPVGPSNFRIHKLCAPLLLGLPIMVNCCPTFSVFVVQPARIRLLGLVNSPVHVCAWPFSSLVSIEMSTCGLMNRNSLTVPLRVSVCPMSKAAAP